VLADLRAGTGTFLRLFPGPASRIILRGGARAHQPWRRPIRRTPKEFALPERLPGLRSRRLGPWAWRLAGLRDPI
jgi:hypothetical protein